MPTDPTPAAPGGDDLAAYLDGELGPAAARVVEARLARDSAARSRAAGLRQSFDLLDYLPTPGPSADFASRTLTQIEALAIDGPMVTSVFMSARPRRWRVVLLAGVAAVVAGLAGAGGRRWAGRPPAPAPVDLAADFRVCVHLPWYLGVDDLDTVRQLAAPDLFAADPFDLPPAGSAAPEPGGSAADKLIGLFQTLPLARQAQLRRLDADFHALPPAEREPLARALETYAGWLDRLPDIDRRAILHAAPVDRVEVVRRVRQARWVDTLSAGRKQRLTATGADAADEEAALRLADRGRREDWALARRHWDAITASGGPPPWPFADDELKRGVEAFVRTVLKADVTVKADPKADPSPLGRLTRAEHGELRERRDAALRTGGWFLYGVEVYRLAGRHPSLPEPAPGRPVIVDVAGLPADFVRAARQKGAFPRANRAAVRGKWPDFPLDLADEAKRVGLMVPEAFGPCRPADLAPVQAAFYRDVLGPKLTPADRAALAKLEGKWPDWPRRLVALATAADLPVPGVTLPGPPSSWARYYGLAGESAPRSP